MMHMVYTLENSITIGGHFLSFNSLHLTEWTRLQSHLTERSATNALHPGVQRTLARIMLWVAHTQPSNSKEYYSLNIIYMLKLLL